MGWGPELRLDRVLWAARLIDEVGWELVDAGRLGFKSSFHFLYICLEGRLRGSFVEEIGTAFGAR